MRIVIIGSGNVATHIAKTLDGTHEIAQIASRNEQHAQRLAEALGRPVATTTEMNQIIDDADAYIISVNDDSIASVVRSTPQSGLWMHTSGSVGMEVFDGYKQHHGVLYPLQTFSREIEVDMSQVPIFIEGNNETSLNGIKTIADSLSLHTYRADSEQRRQLHIAAVFGCNFANRMWAIADEILKNAGYDFTVMAPLLRATLDKAVQAGPLSGQTGPARRGDKQVMAAHLKSLDAEKAEIYRIISTSIFNEYNEQN